MTTGHGDALGGVGMWMTSKVVGPDDTTERVSLAEGKHNQEGGVGMSTGELIRSNGTDTSLLPPSSSS